MGKANIRKKIEGYDKQLKKHIDKFKEAEERGDVGSMNYMGREITDYVKQIDKLKKRMMPK
jgi:peptidoglycan hydrolase CwlO-like protein